MTITTDATFPVPASVRATIDALDPEHGQHLDGRGLPATDGRTFSVLDKATDLRGCPRVNLVLELTWLSGQPMVVHTFRPHDQRPGWGGIYEHG